MARTSDASEGLSTTVTSSETDNNDLTQNVNLSAIGRTRHKRKSGDSRRKKDRSGSGSNTSSTRKGERSSIKTDLNSSLDSGAGGEDEDDGEDEEEKAVLKSYANVLKLDKPASASRKRSKRSDDSPEKRTDVSENGISSIKDSDRLFGDMNENHRLIATSDSAFSSGSTPSAIPASVVSTANDSCGFSSPTFSERSRTSNSPKRSKSPHLSRALKSKHERIRRERDLDETRERLQSRGFGEKGVSAAAAGISRSRSAHERARSMDSRERYFKRKYKYLTGVDTSASFGSLGDVNERVSQRKSRSKSGDSKRTVSYESRGTSPARITPTTSGQSADSLAVTDSKDGAGNQDDAPGSTSNSTPRPTSSTQSPERSKRNKSRTSSSSTLIVDATADVHASSNSKHSLKKPENENHSDRKNLASKDQNEHNASSSHDVVHHRVSTSSDDHHHSTSRSRGIQLATAEEVEQKTSSAIDAILKDELPDIPYNSSTTEAILQQWRADMFRAEMMRLRKEVNDFRQFCQNQIYLQAIALEQSWANNGNTHQNGGSSEPPRIKEQLQDLETSMKLYQRKQNLIDMETQLLEKEERLVGKQKDLEDYEKEIIEVESMLQHRQAICDRRQKALVSLDEELQTLRMELEDTKEQIQSDGSIPESNSERARKNWDMVRRNLMDKQQLLETTVQKYRSELASATSTIAGKDILIARLQAKAMEHEEELCERDKKIKQLESRLTVSISESRNLSEQLSSSGGARELLGSSHYSRSDSVDYQSALPSRSGTSQELSPDIQRGQFRPSTMYRRPSNNAGYENTDDFNGALKPSADINSNDTRSSLRLYRKRASVSDNAISRLTLSTPRNDDKFGRGSSACVVQ